MVIELATREDVPAVLALAHASAFGCEAPGPAGAVREVRSEKRGRSETEADMQPVPRVADVTRVEVDLVAELDPAEPEP